MVTLFILYIFQGVCFKLMWNKGLDAKLTFNKKQVFFGEQAQLTEIVTNKKLLPLPWIWVKFYTDRSLVFDDNPQNNKSDNYYRNDIFFLLSYQRISRRLNFTCTKRGYFTIKQLEILSSGVLFQDKDNIIFPCDYGITVYPKLLEDYGLDIINTKILGEISTHGFINPDPFEFVGVREYNYNDSFKDINFNACAKTGQLMTNIHSPSITKNIHIVLYFKQIEMRNIDDLFEKAISICATLAKKYINSGFNVSLTSNGKDCIENTCCCINAGNSSYKLTEFFENLARLDLNKAFEPININYENDNVIFVTPVYDEQTQALFKDISNKNFARWILPAMYSYEYKNINNPLIYVWSDNNA